MMYALMMRASDGRPCFVKPCGTRVTIEPDNGIKFTGWAFCYSSEEEARNVHKKVIALYNTTPADFVWPSLEYAQELEERLSEAFIVRKLT
jgi:hypothetical protein